MKNFKRLFLGILVLIMGNLLLTAQVLETSQILLEERIQDCPDSGKCTLELLTNKNFELKQDKFGNNYPFITNGDHFLVVFTYRKTPIPDVEDSSYKEVLYIDLGETLKSFSLRDKQLKDANVVYGRLCFCPDETGYYPIRNGTLTVTMMDKDKLQIEFVFSMNKVPQVIRHFSNIISLS
jgi:hypothetical protein